MQIDFHHAVTYVVARLSGFEHEKADIIAHCAQYVDDATNSGTILFEKGQAYARISSAHKLSDPLNFIKLDELKVWLPFHFLPGNNGKVADNNTPFVEKIICRPNSPVAQDMINDCISDQRRPYSLHRLGVTMHVYADTWAHQGFAGIRHEVNHVKEINAKDETFENHFQDLESAIALYGLPLGHGPALTFPDHPYLVWDYTNGRGEKVRRDNPSDFLEASDNMCKAMKCYKLNTKLNFNIEGLPEKDKKIMKEMFKHVVYPDGDVRHKEWLKHIENGYFSFGKQKIEYIEKGEGSWKFEALGTTKKIDDLGHIFPYKQTFLTSNWKLFHDAIQAHRFIILHDILPRYNICAS